MRIGLLLTVLCCGIVAAADDLSQEDVAAVKAAAVTGTAERIRDLPKLIRGTNSRSRKRALGAELQQLKEGTAVTLPILDVTRLKTGQIGIVTYNDGTFLKVSQVLGPTTLLGELTQQHPLTFRQRTEFIWVEGVSTQDVRDGHAVELPGAFRARGTKTYDTVLGGTKTVHVIEALDVTGCFDKGISVLGLVPESE